MSNFYLLPTAIFISLLYYFHTTKHSPYSFIMYFLPNICMMKITSSNEHLLNEHSSEMSECNLIHLERNEFSLIQWALVHPGDNTPTICTWWISLYFLYINIFLFELKKIITNKKKNSNIWAWLTSSLQLTSY